MTDQPPEMPASVPAPQKPMTPAERDAARAAQRKRNIAIALGLVGFIILVYVVTVLKMGGAVANRPL
ncbi:hypothetical protein [Caulobacter sp. NIBR1757]|uniref:hypothetical protein n=1 Tax=Caulobacter sp. NIBR1757 TaxID=3016000 RepID=UPI0022F07F12|nr:hypothetical protein [Caulobacter sp. NIBR1757]WGM37921.1 hypothetical protein AMEJIAPC_00822 [Caulobacter sp. NIBR1757]